MVTESMKALIQPIGMGVTICLTLIVFTLTVIPKAVVESIILYRWVRSRIPAEQEYLSPTATSEDDGPDDGPFSFCI